MIKQVKNKHERNKVYTQTEDDTNMIRQELGYNSKESSKTDFDRYSYKLDDSRENSLIHLEDEISAKRKSAKEQFEEKYNIAQAKKDLVANSS